MFKICGQKGFHITFDNGYTVSVQFGAGNYCDNYDLVIMDYRDKAVPPSRTAETALLAPNGDFVQYKGDDVQGRQTPEDVLELLNYAASLTYHTEILMIGNE
jgi:hypothetical protein